MIVISNECFYWEKKKKKKKVCPVIQFKILNSFWLYYQLFVLNDLKKKIKKIKLSLASKIKHQISSIKTFYNAVKISAEVGSAIFCLILGKS